jgi:hypothetical protein
MHGGKETSIGGGIYLPLRFRISVNSFKERRLVGIRIIEVASFVQRKEMGGGKESLKGGRTLLGCPHPILSG